MPHRSGLRDFFPSQQLREALAVPKPTGGVVVFAGNSLLCLNQSMPAYDVALKELTTAPPPSPCTTGGHEDTLDCAQAAFISYDKMAISLKGSKTYVLTLSTNGMCSVQAFHFSEAAASVLTTSMVTMEPGYLFLGSRLGNSLLKYTEKQQEPLPVPSLRLWTRKNHPQSRNRWTPQWAGQGASQCRRTRWLRLRFTAKRPSQAHSWPLTPLRGEPAALRPSGPGLPIMQCIMTNPCVVMSAKGHGTIFLLKSDEYRATCLALQKSPLHHQSKAITLRVP
ncbi:Cleavage And Polyadenylation Specificity Factor Subunit 1 [Manis pentadactyla]|nr:Cleavage And Polyadenylation Specificity Factor Subunit 1 [Manis pentadactyla]